MTKEHILLFNKESGEFFAKLNHEALNEIDDTFFTVKVLKYDEDTHKWNGGNATDGKVEAIYKIIPVITEDMVNGQASVAIDSVYKPHHELNAIFDVLNEIIEKENLSSEAVDTFKKVRGFINRRRTLNKRYKEAYSNDPNWEYLDKKALEEKSLREGAGGLAEKINSLG
tara:strand:- start:41 stop:550 length:510 start_codon:yes stop_codon:yes gene_type:complete